MTRPHPVTDDVVATSAPRKLVVTVRDEKSVDHRVGGPVAVLGLENLKEVAMIV